MDYIRIIRNLREDADKTQTEIAEILGTSQTMYARYERGASEMPIRHLITLCNYYHVSSDYILGLKEDKKYGVSHLRHVFLCYHLMQLPPCQLSPPHSLLVLVGQRPTSLHKTYFLMLVITLLLLRSYFFILTFYFFKQVQ